MAVNTKRGLMGLLALGVLILVGVLLVAGFFRVVTNSDADVTKESLSDAQSVDDGEAQSVSSDGAYVFFMDARTGQTTAVPDSIASVSAAEEFRPSPDGARLAFNSDSTIYVAKMDGSKLRPLVDAHRWSAPSWSPDGKLLTFNSEGRVFTVNVATGKSIVLTSSGSWVFNPNFSADGKKILFTRAQGAGEPPSLWVVPANGKGRPAELLEGAAGGTYSPDGRSIAFRRVTTPIYAYNTLWMTESALWLADADGGNARRVHGFGKSADYQTDPGAIVPRWSPDSKRIVYEPNHAAYPDTNAGIVVVHLPAGETTRLGSGTKPSWVDNEMLIVERW